MDESYFGGKRKGRRGRGAAGKVPVFWRLKRGGKVYAKGIPNAKSQTLKAIMDHKIVSDSIVSADAFSSYNYWTCWTSNTIGSSSQAIHGQEKPPQRHGEFLELGQAAYEEIQWRSQGACSAIFEGMRVAGPQP